MDKHDHGLGHLARIHGERMPVATSTMSKGAQRRARSQLLHRLTPPIPDKMVGIMEAFAADPGLDRRTRRVFQVVLNKVTVINVNGELKRYSNWRFGRPLSKLSEYDCLGRTN